MVSTKRTPEKAGFHPRRPTHLTVALSMLSPALQLESSAFLVVFLLLLIVLVYLGKQMRTDAQTIDEEHRPLFTSRKPQTTKPLTASKKHL